MCGFYIVSTYHTINHTIKTNNLSVSLTVRGHFVCADIFVSFRAMLPSPSKPLQVPIKNFLFKTQGITKIRGRAGPNSHHLTMHRSVVL